MMRAIKKTVKHIVSPKYAYLKKFDIGKGDIVIDLGANVGEVSEYFLAKGAKVYAYEPNPYAYEVLVKRTGKNGNMVPRQAAVSNFSGRSNLFLHKEHKESEVKFSQGGSLQSEKDNVGKDSIEVEVENIADILEKHSHIKLIKIDIEGGEYDIMDEILKSAAKIDYILLETHEEKSDIFREKNKVLMAKIENSEHKNKIFLDWF